MNRTLSLIIASLSMSVASWAGNPAVTFLLRNGQTVSFAFEQKPVVAVGATEMSISLAGVPKVSYAYADVLRVYLSDEDLTAVKPVISDKSQAKAMFSWIGGTLSVSGLSAAEQVSVYALDGKLVWSAKAQADGTLQLPLSTLRQGNYIVRTQGGISYKLFNK